MKKVLISLSVLLAALVSMPALADDCVDIELGTELITGDPYDILALYFSVENCGTEAREVIFTISLTVDLEDVWAVTFPFTMAAGEPFVAEYLELTVCEVAPPGEYTFCVSAEIGTAYDSACATIVIGENSEVISFIPFSPTATEESSWGSIKAMHR